MIEEPSLEEPCDLPEPLHQVAQELHGRIINMLVGYVAEHELDKTYDAQQLTHMLFHMTSCTLASLYEPVYTLEGPELFAEVMGNLTQEAMNLIQHGEDDEDDDDQEKAKVLP